MGETKDFEKINSKALDMPVSWNDTSLNKDPEPVYVAVCSNPPQYHKFKDLGEVTSFLNSPENKRLNSSARFKLCKTDDEISSFCEEVNSFCEDLSLDNLSITTETSSESTPRFSEPASPELNQFRTAIETKNNEFFDSCIEQNPRFLINTSNDNPTIIQGSQRQNALHIACVSGNVYVVDRLFKLLKSEDFLFRVYGKINDIKLLRSHLLDCFVNMPDKNANNTPLHMACKNNYLDIVRLLLAFEFCDRAPKNRFNLTPYDVATRNIQQSSEGKDLQKAKESRSG